MAIIDQIAGYIKNGVLTLPSTNNLDSPGINSLIATYFNNTLQVTVSQPSSQGLKVVYQGDLRGTFLFSRNAAVTLTFSLDENNVLQLDAQLAIPGSYRYRFVDSFPILANYPNLSLNGLTFINFTFGISTLTDINTITINSKVDQSSDIFSQLSWLVPSNPFPIQGTIKITPDKDPLLYPTLNLTGSLQAYQFVGYNLEFDFRILTVSLPTVGISSFPTSFIATRASLVTKIGSTTIPLVLQLYRGTSYLMSLSLDTTQQIPVISSISDLADFIDSSSLQNTLAQGPSLGRLSLKNFSVTLNPQFKQLSNISFELDLDTSWNIPNTSFSIKTISAIVNIPNITDKSTFGVSLIGIFQIDSASIEVEVSLPDKTLIGKLVEGDSFQGSGFEKNFVHNLNLPSQSPSSPAINGLTINDLFINLDITNKQYYLEALATGNLVITDGFKVNELGFYIEFAHSSFQIVSFSSTFSLQDIVFYIQVTRDETSSNQSAWNFVGNAPSQPVPIGTFINNLAAQFGVTKEVPDFINTITISDIALSLTYADNTISNFNFEFITILQIADYPCIASLLVNLTQQNSGYVKSFSGTLNIGELKFSIAFNDAQITAALVPVAEQSITLQDFINALLTTDTPTIPTELNFQLQDLTFIYTQGDSTFSLTTQLNNVNITITLFKIQDKHNILISFNKSVDIMSQLPLVGGSSYTGLTGINNLNILHASTDSSKITAPPSIPGLPSTFKQGWSINGDMQIVGHPSAFNLSIDSNSPPLDSPTGSGSNLSGLLVNDKISIADTNSPNTATSQEGYWINVQKIVGPIHVQQIGLNYSDQKVWILLNASLNTPVLNIELVGLGAGIDIQNLSSFNVSNCELHGLDVSLVTGPVILSGGLVRIQQPPAPEQYDGSLLIQASNFSLQAIGSYSTTVDGNASLFAFCVIDYPLGGPPCLFITGGATGFGYNRNLILPDITQVQNFPLVEAAMNPSSYISQSLPQVVSSMGNTIPIQAGSYWLAAGITFTSFEMLQSFALVSASFGVQFEIELIGLSSLAIPAQTSSPVAVAQLALSAKIIPSEGEVAFVAQLTNNSYILSPDCHLTGGFAFYTWFSPSPYAGDFVVTLGGYHPSFIPPGYYPTVPRLGLNWVISEQMYIQGKQYFALTPACVMAGGAVQAVWKSDNIQAWFDLYYDILLFWKPYIYVIDAGVDIGVTVHVDALLYSFDVTVSVGADLSIYGPPFSGTAHIHLYIVSFTISFGDISPQSIPPITWSDFKSSFITNINPSVLSAHVNVGLISKSPTPTCDWVIDANNFELTIDSLIPSKTLTNKAATHSLENFQSQQYNTQFGVGLVQVDPDNFTSDYSITVTKNGGSYQDLTIKPIVKSIPQALWQSESITSVDQLYNSAISRGNNVITNVVTGFKLGRPAPIQPDVTLSIRLENLLLTIGYQASLIAYIKPSNIPTTDPYDQAGAEQQIQQTIMNNSKRKAIISMLNSNNFQVFSPNFGSTISPDKDKISTNKSYFIQVPILNYLGEEKPISIGGYKK